MPFEIIRNDITNMRVDAIVNTANPRPVIGSGTDAAIHAKAGPMLLGARKLIGTMSTGEVCITPGFKLPCKYVIHTVGPVWEDGARGEGNLLRQCYEHSLKIAWRHRCKSIAFPLISTGNYGFPKKLALQIAVETIRKFLEEHDMHVYLVVFNKESLELSGGLVNQVRSFIDDAYVQEREKAEYSFNVSRNFELVRERLGEPESVSECEELPADWDQVEDTFHLEFDWDETPTILESDVSRYEFEEQEKMISTGALPRIDPPQLNERASRPAYRPVSTVKAPSSTPEFAKASKPEWNESRAPEPEWRESTLIPLFDEKELQKMVQQTDAGFSETLLKLIDKSGEKDSDVYKRANVDRKLFSKIRNNPQYKPSKSTAVAFAIALELDLEETRDFIGRAGYALSRSNKFDIIIEYFITHGRYDIYEINMMLFEFDQSLLGA